MKDCVGSKRETIIAEIEQLKKDLRFQRELLVLHDRHFPDKGESKGGRFFQVKRRYAIPISLQELGRAVPEADLIKAFVDGDGIRDKSEALPIQQVPS